MRKIIGFVLALLFLAIASQSEAFVPVFNRGNIILFDGETHSDSFSLTQSSGEFFLWVTTRIKLVRGESWGEHVLSLKINDQFVTDSHGPINRESVIRNVAYLNNPPVPVFSAEKKSWFVRYDSDFIAWNGAVPAQPGDPYNKTAYLNRANELLNQKDFMHQNYVYVFKISSLLNEGTNTLDISCQGIPELLRDYPLEISSIAIAKVENELLLYSRYFMDLIYPWTVPMPEEINQGISIKLAQNEYEPATVGFYAVSAVDGITVEVGSITGSSGEFPKENISLTLVEYKQWFDQDSPERWESLRRMQAGLGDDRKGITPELLGSFQQINIPAGESRQVWFKVNAEGVAPGQYQGVVLFKKQQQVLGRVPISIEVLPITLPDSPVRFGAWFRTKPDSPMGREQLRNLKEYGYSFVTVDCYIATPQISLQDGEVKIDYTQFDAVIEGYQAEGMNLGPMMYGTLGPIINQVANLSGATLGEEEFDDLFVKVFCYIQKHCKEKNWEIYFAPIDEPHPYPDKMAQEIQYLALLKRAGAKTFSTITPGGAYILQENLDIHCQGANFLVEALQGKTGQKLYWEDVEPEWVVENTRWVYKQIRSFPFDRYYHGYQAYRMGIEVLMGFAYNWGSQDWYVIKIEGNEIKNSIGWESAREGIDDLRYVECLFKLWEKKYGTATAKEKIEELLEPVYTDDWKEPTYDIYLQMRETLQSAIIQELNNS